ncbi:NCA2-domain-containing protein [Meira miltonrushii]|uniref:NCA2-domain-containing protein n=1 Tax=Meira miltonrushii TaxID=1280837 RepID=A0A316VG47_9BASI|nr:NCA2-domain-containing protein [Meira miltonrushii]PWN35293.1 NCA2-domain-containing protein [Meira miltonrushii]
MPNESFSFALDAVRKQSSRLDSIQDHLSGSLRTPASEGEDDAKTQELVRVESSFNSQITQSKSLLDQKQLNEALNTLSSSRLSNESSILLLPQSNGQVDVASDQVALFELISAARLTYSVYGLVLDDLLNQAETVNDQAWYWTEVEEDPIQTITYLVQTLPERIINLAVAIGKKLGETTLAPLSSASQDRSLSHEERHRRAELSFNTETLRRSWNIIRESPVLAIGALFPLSVNEDTSSASNSFETFNRKKKSKKPQLVSAARILTPLGLTRHEARSKRGKLIKQRDEMAIKVGTLSQALSEVDARDTKNISAVDLQNELWERVKEMQNALQVQDTSEASTSSSKDLSSSLHELVNYQISQQRKHVDFLLSSAPVGLGLPTRLARLWPALVLGPVVSLVAIRLVTRSWDTIVAKAQDARETVKGFAVNWVYDPCIKLLDTIRTGDQEGMIISPESLNSDLQSLERMVSDFSAEKYGISGPELDEVAARVREGDLTTVLRIYETELKSPLKSAISGSLIRSLLIQIQKVKVDIAVAMRGVDQLLKSQQLLFGAIGIAPAMGILYIVGGFFKTRVSIALGGQGKRIGQSVRYRAWEAMRRIDRLLADTDLASGPLPPLTQGLLLLDLALLRRLAPQLVAQAAGAGSGNRGTRAKRLRAEFLNDIRDLESWHARRAAVDRMWKSWGHFMSLSTSS